MKKSVWIIMACLVSSLGVTPRAWASRADGLTGGAGVSNRFLAAPGDGSIVAGVVEVIVDTSKASGEVGKVDFFLDGNTPISVQYSRRDGVLLIYQWDTRTA